MSSTAWVVGATGLVGRQVVGEALRDERFEVHAFVRRPSGLAHPRLRERIVDFEALESELAGQAADIAFCCLGSTIKQAGSQAQFRHIDHDYVLAFGRAARAAGVRHLLVVTALGADSSSSIFYNRVKGEVEQALTELDLPALTIARPSLLLGDRSEFRLGERLFAPISKLLPKSIGGIEARTVARALVRLAREPASGKRVVLSKELHALAS